MCMTYFLRTLPDILLEPIENAISQMLIAAITECKCNQLDGTIPALLVRLGVLGMGTHTLKQAASRLFRSTCQHLSFNKSYLSHISYQKIPC